MVLAQSHAKEGVLINGHLQRQLDWRLMKYGHTDFVRPGSLSYLDISNIIRELKKIPKKRVASQVVLGWIKALDVWVPWLGLFWFWKHVWTHANGRFLVDDVFNSAKQLRFCTMIDL